MWKVLQNEDVKKRVTPSCSVGAGGALAWLYLLEEPDEDDAEEAEQREPAEDIDEGPAGGLAEEFAVESCGGESRSR